MKRNGLVFLQSDVCVDKIHISCVVQLFIRNIPEAQLHDFMQQIRTKRRAGHFKNVINQRFLAMGFITLLFN